MSIRGFAAALMGTLVLVQPALALSVQEQVLQVSYKYKGVDYVFNDTYVPLLPGNACYNWYLRLDQVNTTLTVTEQLKLPEAIDWGTAATDPNDGIEVKESGTVAESTIATSTDGDGWITHGWCVAAGDPVGHHSMQVSVDGQPLATFDFDVLAADQYNYPAGASSPWANRTANQVW